MQLEPKTIKELRSCDYDAARSLGFTEPVCMPRSTEGNHLLADLFERTNRKFSFVGDGMVIGNRCGNIRAPDAAGSGIEGRPISWDARDQRALNRHFGDSTESVAPDRLLSCIAVNLSFAPVAQLDRAPGYEPGGREFESLRAHQFVLSTSTS
jgi:hypothetical protein